MTPALAAARPSGNLHRVSRGTDAWAWPPWAYAGEDGTFGNRFDDPAGEYRVLYATSQRVGAFVETLARYRTDPAVVAEYEEIAIEPEDADRYPTIAPGVVPADWCSSRTIGTARHDGLFADIAHSSSLADLRVALASRLVHFGLDDLEAGDVRRRAPRAFTQEISRYVFERGVTEEGERLLGVRYLSRLGDDIENWAIFEGSDPYDKVSEEIVRDDPDLLAALRTLDLVMAERSSA
jgi:hypothetical protein